MRDFGFLTAAGMPLVASLAGANLAEVFALSEIAGALIGGLCGLLSVLAKGVFDIIKLRMQHRQLERQMARYKRKLLKAGIEPDTED